MKQMICAVGKNSDQDWRSEKPQEAPGTRAPKQQQAQKCEKSWKGSRRGNNGGGPQRKQVGPKPAYPSFQPSTAEIRAAGRPNITGAAKHTWAQLKIVWISALTVSWRVKESKKKKKKESQLPQTSWRTLWYFLHVITSEITCRYDICLHTMLLQSRAIFKQLRRSCI